MGSSLGGDHHVSRRGEQGESRGVVQLAVLVDADAVLFIERTAAFPASPVSMRGGHIAIGTDVETADLGEKNKGLEFQGAPVAVKPAGVLDTTIHVQIAALDP